MGLAVVDGIRLECELFTRRYTFKGPLETDM